MQEKINVRCWGDLVGIESNCYKLDVDMDLQEGWIIPKVENEITLGDFWRHHRYLGRFLFDPNPPKDYESLLKSYGFEVKIVPRGGESYT